MTISDLCENCKLNCKYKGVINIEKCNKFEAKEKKEVQNGKIHS